ncbi:PRC-barrel domain-containing protein [Fodinicurvata halophila]|uniref:PRC-barrel domain-containing protein n=1 Tax=Fodinicurvata halophila TaxID=1419723 RepID=A0ABV8UP93_9PROT
MKPRLITLISAFALLLSSTSLALAQSSTPSEKDSGQPAETTETSPDAGSGVNAEAGKTSDNDAAPSVEEGTNVNDGETGAAEAAEEDVENAAEATDDAAEDAAETVEETMESDTAEEPTVNMSNLRPLKGEYEGVMLSNGMDPEEVVGAAIVNSEGDEVARVEDLLADQSGEAVAVLAEAGGILGIGAKQIAIPLSELSAGENGQLASSLTEEDIETMPEYEAPEDTD